MIGVFLASLATLFEEIGTVIGKVEVARHKESEYTMGFLNMFWTTVIFVVLAVAMPTSYVFVAASLPFFLIRVFFEIIQAHIMIHAIVVADRSSYSFLRIITIPLLLIVDLALGYAIGYQHMIGMGVIMLTLIVLFLSKGISKKGIWFVIIAAVNPVITISLYKYNIENFNSVVAEQLLGHLITATYFLFASWFVAKEHPFRMLKKLVFFGQSAGYGIGSAINSFAYSFAPASVIIAVRRSSTILWSIVSGNKVFHEHHALLKVTAFVLLTVGIVLLI